MTNKIKAYRIKQGLTQEELGDLLGVGRAAVAQWERGVNLPKPKTLLNLANIFNCSMEDLLYPEK